MNHIVIPLLAQGKMGGSVVIIALFAGPRQGADNDQQQWPAQPPSMHGRLYRYSSVYDNNDPPTHA